MTGLRIFFGGAEIPGHRDLLVAQGVDALSLSYVGLRRRVKHTLNWDLASRFSGDRAVFLDSGAHSVNKKPEARTTDELLEIWGDYKEFVLANIDSVDMVSEFDAIPLGQDWIAEQRESFWSQIPDDKFLPVWHPDTGVEALEALAAAHSRVGVPSTDLSGRNLIPALNGLVQQYGTRLHGVNMSKVDDMAAVKWDSISTISWLSPSQYGDTIIWTGKELKRYPVKYKEQSRKRWRTYLEGAGFDAEAIALDDTKEVLRLSVWSWLQLSQNLGKHRPAGKGVTPSESGNPEIGGEGVDTEPSESGQLVPTTRFREPHERSNLPVLGIGSLKETYVDPESGGTAEREVPLIRSRSQSMRLCKTCFLASKCPAYEPNSNCAYDIPIEIKGRDQFRSAVEALIEMQYQRVLFMKMAEDLEGGYADPNLSSEMDRLNKMLKTKSEMDETGFSLKIEAKERGQIGAISRLFGRDAGEQARALPASVSVEDLSKELGIVEGEIVED